MAISMTAAEVAHRLGGAKPAGEGWSCRCPAHEDKKASLWIKDRSGGGLHVRCHADCARETVENVLREKGLWPQTGAPKADNRDEKRRRKASDEIDEFVTTVPPNAPEPDWAKFRRPSPNRVYSYHDANGALVYQVARWDDLASGKDIRPISYARFKDGSFGWVMRAPSPPYYLYNLAEVVGRPAAPVLVVEGEKAAEAGKKHFPDHVVVTWPFGAAATDKTDFSPLAGRNVVLWPDADEPGEKAMIQVAGILQAAGVAQVQRVVLPDGLPKGWDIADTVPVGVILNDLISSAVVIEDVASPDGGSGTLDLAPSPKGLALRPLVVTADALMRLELPERALIIDPFLPTSSLSMIYGPRGGGKTWVGLSLAVALAEGEDFLAYRVERPWNVLYVDGEMAFAELQDRIGKLSVAPPATFMILPSERLFQEARPINLHEAEDQAAIETLLGQLAAEGVRPDVIIFDNLSSLSGGVDENDNSALDHLLQWLIKLRHTGVAIVLVHHAGKNGTQRGASRREDLLDTSISLLPPPEDAEPHGGAHLVFKFAKVRGARPNPDTLELRLTENRGTLQWQFSQAVQVDRATHVLRACWEHRPPTQAELARCVGVSDGAISQHLKKLRKAGYVGDGTPPALTPSGLQRLIDVWPELEHRMMQQGELPLGKII